MTANIITIKDIDIEWVRDLAYKNVEIQDGDIRQDLNSTRCFAWANTPEDEEFWASVYDTILECGYIDTNLMSIKNPKGYKVYKKMALKLKLDKYIKLI